MGLGERRIIFSRFNALQQFEHNAIRKITIIKCEKNYSFWIQSIYSNIQKIYYVDSNEQCGGDKLMIIFVCLNIH